MKALILGHGVSGKSAQVLLERRGASVTIHDDHLHPQMVRDLSGYDLFVPSPGIPFSHPLYQEALSLGIPTEGEIEIFLQQTDQICIGVTGTNGKTTTVQMIAHLLNAGGKRSVFCGNIGVPLCSVDPSAICVLELSSFQLETLKTRGLEMGVLLNISEDHLDRYPSYESYRNMKISLEKVVREDGKLFVHESIDPSFFSRPIERFSGECIEAAKCVCEALGVCEFSSLESFERSPHRLEYVSTLEGTVFINDSKATNVAATIYALSKMGEGVVLILGGRDKGLSFSKLKEKLPKGCRVVIYGEAREKIANELQPLSEVYQVERLEEAVDLSKRLASKGEAVLFSPGCSSFDAFENYAERGKAFREFVLRSV